MSNPWFRLYSEIIDDEKVRMLAFEDRWHYVALLCLKNSGYLDKSHKPGMLIRGLSVKLGLTGVDLENLKERLTDVDLVDADWQPLGWDKRQFKSDVDSTVAERQRRYRERKKQEKTKGNETVTDSNALRNGGVTRLDTEADTDTDTELVVSNETTAANAACPHQAVIEVYHEVLPELSRVVDWTPQRQALLRQRWREKPERQSLDWWREFFELVSASDFLMGRAKDFRADLEWLIRPKNFIKVIEGRYTNRQAETLPYSEVTRQNIENLRSFVHGN